MCGARKVLRGARRKRQRIRSASMAYVRKNALCLGLTFTILHLCTACAIRNTSPVQTYPPPGDQDEAAFNFWLTDSPAKSVAEFQGFLAGEGVDDVIPIHQLLRTASDWEECEGPAFQVPKREHW